MRRLFFGLELPDEWKDELHALQSALKTRQVEAGAWSNPQLLHITVLFLGMVSDQDDAAIMEAGRQAAEQVRPIRLTTGALGQFSRNKVFWLGLWRNETDWDELTLLNRTVKDQVMERLPLELDEKHYRPHITLARKLRSQVDVDRLRAPDKLTTVVSNLALFESIRIDGQLQYPVRARFELTGPGN